MNEHLKRWRLPAAFVAAVGLGAAALPGAALAVDIGKLELPGYVLTTSIWTSPTISVCWENPTTANAQARTLVQQAVARTWEAVTPLRFVGWNQCASNARGIRIRWTDVRPGTKGLGNQLDGLRDGMRLNHTFQNWGTACQPTVNYCVEVIAVHEFGHAIGLAHEQNRPDTPSSCTDKPQGTNGDYGFCSENSPS